MLRLRRTIERAAGHPWFGFAVIALVLVLLAFLVLHVVEHVLLGPTSLVCALLAVAFVLRLLAGPGRPRSLPARRAAGRAPPLRGRRRATVARPMFVPLRS